VTADDAGVDPTAGLEAPDLGSRHLVTHVADRVLHVRVDRVERRNAYTQEMYRGLKRAAVWADGQPELDAVCLTGTGEWFGAGGDMAGRSEDPDGLAAEWDATDHFPFRHIERCRKLWVAKVNGLCHAGSLDLVLHCDVAIASDRARFRVPELLRGIPDVFMSARLAQHVGLARARWLLFTAAQIDATQAAAMGLVGQVVPHDELDATVEHALDQIRRTGPAARAVLKRDLNRVLAAHDFEAFRSAVMSPEMVEGMAAFVQKRDPVWPR
jgi:enoyl-CoA hydratase/carnithine racemase